MKQLHDPRQLRGLEILSEPDMIRAVGNHEWAVKSQNGNGEYTVSREEGLTGIDMFSVKDDSFERRLDEVIHEGWQSPK